MKLELEVNGRMHSVDVDPVTPLLTVLRDEIGLLGTKEGCNEGECGACTVLIDGDPVDSCIYAAAAATDMPIETIEGVGSSDNLNVIQKAFVDACGIQCGFCTPGFVMTTTALLRTETSMSPESIREALAGNICRCTGYTQIVDAVVKAASQNGVAG